MAQYKVGHDCIDSRCPHEKLSTISCQQKHKHMTFFRRTSLLTVVLPILGCVEAVCGNSFLEKGEACDDGDTFSGDGCSSQCISEIGLDCGPPPYPELGALLQFCDLQGEDLSGLTLSSSVFAFANLKNTDLSNTDLQEANLFHCNLTNADLSTETNPSGAKTDLSGANLSGADLSRANLTKAFINIGLTNLADLTDANLEGAILSEFDLSKARITNANLTNADLAKTKTSGLLSCPGQLPNIDFLCRPTPSTGNFALLGPKVDLSNAKLINTDLKNANLTNADLSNANLTNANLDGTDLTDANLSGAIGQPLNPNQAHYENTTCPDGTNSDDINNGGICVF
jgi:cysteine-rich repeat protein